MSDSITWRRFCRIPLDGSVPHPTTLMKLTTRCGAAAVDGLNEALLAKATEAKVLRTTTLRADTTVVPSNVSYPTDSGLLAKAIRRIAVTGKRIQAAGGATRTRVRDRSRAAGRRAHAIGFKLRSRSAAGRDEALAAVRHTTGELADLAETAATDAERLLANAKHALRRARAKATALKGTGAHDGAAGRRRGRLARAIDDPRGPGHRHPADHRADPTAAGRADPGRSDPAGQPARPATPGPSPRDGSASPSSSATRPSSSKTGDGVIVDHNVERGNPADAPQLAPAVDRVRTRAGRPPRTVTADRGYGEKAVEDDLRDLGVRNVVIPRKGKPSADRRAEEHRPAFRRTIKWRTGVEGRISALKRGYGWDRTRIDSTEGAKIWVGHGVLAHNLVKISTLAA